MIFGGCSGGGVLAMEEPVICNFRVKPIALGKKLFLICSHFLSVQRIAGLLGYPDAQVRAEAGESAVYMVVRKNMG